MSVEVLSGLVRDRTYLVALDAVDPEGQLVEAPDLSWPYSKSLDCVFAYLSATSGGYVDLPKVTSRAPVSTFRLRVLPWAKGKSGPPPEVEFGRLVYRYGTAPLPVGSGTPRWFAGVITPQVVA
ncbi:hypothetical protein N803_06365 [Knoellia subterranea KCTC 19937]|uniref:Uncharacterized protein n=2 Tax=Knoellia TaxID=136099 RepID=A0A0A0JE68_9MICO|nr:hypothetical protein N803_06365 [Knoellia subterranea KCTC 19937]